MLVRIQFDHIRGSLPLPQLVQPNITQDGEPALDIAVRSQPLPRTERAKTRFLYQILGFSLISRKNQTVAVEAVQILLEINSRGRMAV